MQMVTAKNVLNKLLRSGFIDIFSCSSYLWPYRYAQFAHWWLAFFVSRFYVTAAHCWNVSTR